MKKNYEIKEFNINGEKIKVKYIKNSKEKFIANASGFGIFGIGHIKIEDTFYQEFSKDEQNSIILHELWHYKNNLKFDWKILSSRKFLIACDENKLSKLQEYEADKYSARKNGKKYTISYLKKIGLLYKKGKIKYNFKNHPSIKERIKSIEKIL